LFERYSSSAKAFPLLADPSGALGGRGTKAGVTAIRPGLFKGTSPYTDWIRDRHRQLRSARQPGANLIERFASEDDAMASERLSVDGKIISVTA